MRATPLLWTDALDRLSAAAEWLGTTLEVVAREDVPSRLSVDHFRTWVRHVRVGLWDATPLRAAVTAKALRWEIEDFLREGSLLASVEVRTAWQAFGDAVQALTPAAAVRAPIESGTPVS